MRQGVLYYTLSFELRVHKTRPRYAIQCLWATRHRIHDSEERFFPIASSAVAINGVVLISSRGNLDDAVRSRL